MHYNHKVSIIMGAYNEEKNIGKCIESIIKQTFSDFELIICDDRLIVLLWYYSICIFFKMAKIKFTRYR